jgi:bacterioferritin-associated ferredoxin
MAEKICWCFGYTDEDIVRDVQAHGRSSILEAIMAAKKGGKCDCAHKNPKGK